MKRYIIVFLFLILSLQIHAENKTIKISTLEWPPYIGKELPEKGYIYEVAVHAFKRAGYKVNITFYPWARALHMVETGKTDVLMPEYHSVEREKTCEYSDPVIGGPVGLYKFKSFKIKWKHDPVKQPMPALWDLREFRFGIVRGYINTEAFDSAKFLIKEKVSTDERNIKKLIGKRVNFILIDKYTAKYIIDKKHPDYIDKLEFMEPAMENKLLYFVFSKKAKNYRGKLKAFNKGLAGLKKDGTLKKIIQKHRFLK